MKKFQAKRVVFFALCYSNPNYFETDSDSNAKFSLINFRLASPNKYTLSPNSSTFCSAFNCRAFESRYHLATTMWMLQLIVKLSRRIFPLSLTTFNSLNSLSISESLERNQRNDHRPIAIPNIKNSKIMSAIPSVTRRESTEPMSVASIERQLLTNFFHCLIKLSNKFIILKSKRN